MTRYVDNIYQFTLESFKKAEPIKNYSDLTIDERAPNVTWLFNEHYSPLAHARDNNVPGMLTIGYGTSRFIPAAGTMPRPGEPHRERLESLFGKKDIQGTDFVGHIAVAKGKKRAAAYVKALQKALFTADAALLPHIGRFGASSPETLIHSPTFEFKVGTRKLKVPATWLSQGYQSTISWIADLLGWAFWERDDITEPEEVEGLVLIDELDLHIHPRWQTSLVGALRKIFPKVQFIATTHSPMLLSSMYPEEVIVLEADAKGRVVARQGGVDPRLMTAGELFEKFFGVDTIQPPQLARLVYEYRSIAGNPYRSDAQDARLPELRARLEAERVTPGIEPVARRPLPAAKERG
jgi:hypothetical protein